MYKILIEIIKAGNPEILKSAKKCVDEVFDKNKMDIFIGHNSFKNDEKVLLAINDFRKITQDKINLEKLSAGELYNQIINPLYSHYIK